MLARIMDGKQVDANFARIYGCSITKSAMNGHCQSGESLYDSLESAETEKTSLLGVDGVDKNRGGSLVSQNPL